MERDEFRVKPVLGPAYSEDGPDGMPLPSTYDPPTAFRLYRASWHEHREGNAIKRSAAKQRCRWKLVATFPTEAEAWAYVDAK